MIHKNIVESESKRIPKTYIRWCSSTTRRPNIGIEGVLYVDRDNQKLSIWDESTHKYIEFFKNLNFTKSPTNNESLIVNSNDNNNSSYSFNLVNDTLVITDKEGIIVEIPIPNEKAINEKINLLEERISKLEELLN